MKTLQLKRARKQKRKMRIRKRIIGTAECPRLSVYKSNRYIYLQAIDDGAGTTILGMSTAHGDTRGLKQTVEDGQKFGQAFGERLKARNVNKAVFDRNGNLYHGVIKAVADGARKAGIEF
ncbi:MAG: 50S ribosomal protein L18 [Spirochaetaceae bacterium]|nr:MAG: 50S ribosomal protein L18 [Spirochaetaceae bacterium]